MILQSKVLIIEDDHDISDLVSLYLNKESIVTAQAFSGEEGLLLFNREQWSLVVLDINLPGMDGFRVLKEIRAISKIPVVICSAREADEDVIEGLSSGADDFITKPFSPRILSERVKANLRRSEMSGSTQRKSIQFGPFTFFIDGYYLEKEGERVKMASRELDVLYYLMRNAGRYLTVWDIYKAVWGENHGDVATVAVHIQRIRKKIEIEGLQFIMTSYGSGYQFDASKIKREG
jgi:DNA-binding response OmpR family regulator